MPPRSPVRARVPCSSDRIDHDRSGVRRVRLAGGLDIAYETFGDPGTPPVRLVMGLGTQMLGRPDDLCAALAVHGMFVVRFDNRECGLPTHLDDAPPADVAGAFGGNTSSGHRWAG